MVPSSRTQSRPCWHPKQDPTSLDPGISPPAVAPVVWSKFDVDAKK